MSETPAQERERGGDGARAAWASRLAVPGGFLLIGVVFFRPILFRLSTHILSNDQFNWPGMGGDETAFLWMYWWGVKALSTGESLMHCGWIFPPTGANLVFRQLPFLPLLLTYPLARVFGAVVGNNLMVFLMVVAGAWCFYWFVRRAFGLSRFAAFAAGALFGFCPWFMWKAGGHYNMIGACWWATALGVLVTAYVKRDFGRRNALLFAVFLWATFWSSYIEFFMLGIVCALTVCCFEARALLSGDRAIGRRIAFFAPSLLGLVSLLILLNRPGAQALETELLPGPTFKDLIPSAKLSLFSYLGFPNRTAAIVCHSYVYLAAFGIWRTCRRRHTWAIPLGAMCVLTTFLVIDPLGIPSTMIRALPMGGGFRQFERFTPFMLFFIVIFSALGIEALLRGAGELPERFTRRYRFATLAGILTFAFLELYPFLLHTTELRRLPLTQEAKARLHNGQFCLVVPHLWYYPIYDTYQVTLDVPSVSICGWEHMSQEDKQWREENFPAVYHGFPLPDLLPHLPDMRAPTFWSELEQLDVGFLLFVNKEDAADFLQRGSVLCETAEELLLTVEDYGPPTSVP